MVIENNAHFFFYREFLEEIMAVDLKEILQVAKLV
jgi:hypothetical protein